MRENKAGKAGRQKGRKAGIQGRKGGRQEGKGGRQEGKGGRQEGKVGRKGGEPAVAQFLEKDPRTRAFIDRREEYLRSLVPFYVAEGKSYLTVGMGCTG